MGLGDLSPHFDPHMCPDCGRCWCGCQECKLSLTQGCVCDNCDCDDECWHEDCLAWQDVYQEAMEASDDKW